MLATGAGYPTEVYMIQPIQNGTEDMVDPVSQLNEEMIDTIVADQVVPPGYVVLDTAALATRGGDRAIDSHLEKFDLADLQMPSRTIFKGINTSAPIKAESTQSVPSGIQGRDCTLNFERLPNSDAPMLMSLDQMDALDAVIKVKRNQVIFQEYRTVR